MVKKVETIINCNCLEQKKFRDLTQSDKCICRIGTSMQSQKRVVAKRVNVTIVKEFSVFDQ